MATGYRRKPPTQDQSKRLETIMIFGKKSDLKNHLTTKKQTWSHKVVTKGALDQSFQTDLQKRTSPDRDPPPKFEQSEPIQIR
jgi:hypothetical protein